MHNNCAADQFVTFPHLPFCTKIVQLSSKIFVFAQKGGVNREKRQKTPKYFHDWRRAVENFKTFFSCLKTLIIKE
jgi:hypothetical protein